MECRKQIGINNMIAEKNSIVKGFFAFPHIFTVIKVIVFLKTDVCLPQTGDGTPLSSGAMPATIYPKRKVIAPQGFAVFANRRLTKGKAAVGGLLTAFAL